PEGHPRTLRVQYQVALNEWVSEWICVEHPRNSYARSKAEAWWRARSNEPPPDTAEQAAAICEAGGIAQTTAITVRHVTGEKYDRIIKHELGPIPPRLDGSEEREPPEAVAAIAEDDIPF